MNQELNNLESFTIEEFQEDFDTLIDRVEKGESFVIKSEHGNAVMIPYNEVVQILEESDVSEDIIRIHTDHEEGC
jgi:hypothetical protein